MSKLVPRTPCLRDRPSASRRQEVLGTSLAHEYAKLQYHEIYIEKKKF